MPYGKRLSVTLRFEDVPVEGAKKAASDIIVLVQYLVLCVVDPQELAVGHGGGSRFVGVRVNDGIGRCGYQ